MAIGHAVSRLIALRLEKVFDYLRAVLGQNAGTDLWSVIQSRVTKQVVHRASHACLVIPCTKHNAFHSRKNDRAGAHRARFDGDVQRAVVESPPIQLRRRFANRKHLSMGGWVLISERAIGGCGDDRAIADDYRADRNLVAARRLARDVESVADILLITTT